MYKILYNGKTFTARKRESVLAALLRQGAAPVFSCGKGSCHVCMQRCTSGSVPAAAQRGLKPSLVEKGYFLPCICQPVGDLCIEPPRAEDLAFGAEVIEREQLAPEVCRLLIEPEIDFSYRAGQSVRVAHRDGQWRRYWLASVHGEEPYLELHVRRMPGGHVSRWLHDDLGPGSRILLQGPFGDNFYRPAESHKDLMLIGSGIGLTPLYAIAKQAIQARHRGAIRLIDRTDAPPGGPLEGELRKLRQAHGDFHLSADLGDLRQIRDPSAVRVHIATSEAFVREIRRDLIAAGIPADAIVSESFDSAAELATARDAQYGVAAEPTVFNPDTFPPDPGMWRALDEGRLLTVILEDFYTRVFADERLAPYFQRVTKQRVVEKVYSFLQQAFTGVPAYFVEHPRNAHHWMVIDDDLFEYREGMLVQSMRRHGLAPQLIDRWRAMEERFRRDIVKDKPWKRIVGGIELPVEGYGEVALEIATLCDGCGAEIDAGEHVSYHLRLGTVYGQCCRAGL